MSFRNVPIYVSTAVGISLLMFAIFKHYYPYPNMVMDSYVYLKAAVLHWDVNSYPIGYSKFLELYLYFSNSHSLLIWIQFLLLELSCTLLFITVNYFFRPSELVQCTLLVYLFANPLLIFSSNFIMSDNLYTTISILWLTQLIWIIGRPRPFMIWVNAILVVLAYAVRSNAVYYPLLSSIFIVISSLRRRLKVAAIVLEILFLGLFIQYTRSEMGKLTGIKQCSPVGGWHVANNALYMYSHIYIGNKDRLPQKFFQLDSVVKNYFDHTESPVEVLEIDDRNGFGGYYLDNRKSPLFKYMYWKYGRDTEFINFRKWGPMGTLCADYGTCLIRQHPLAFLHYFVFPNTARYFLPPMEVFESYRSFYLRPDDFGQIAAESLKLKTITVSMSLIDFRTSILSYYPMTFGLLNLFVFVTAGGFLLFGGLKNTNKINLRILLMVAFLMLFNFIFSVTAASIVLRYELFAFIILFVFSILLADAAYTRREYPLFSQFHPF